MALSIMKIHNFGLGFGLAVLAASTGMSSIAEAATLSFSDGSLNLDSQTFEFQSLSNEGWFKSSLFVADAASKSSVQTLFSETAFYDNSPVTPTGPAYWSADTGNFILGLSSTNVDNIAQPEVYSDDVTLVDSVTRYQFKLLSSNDGWYTFGIEDKKGAWSDYDYNDIVFKVRPVPVPAIVPGIALAGAFLGSKALKRNKKKDSEATV